MPGRDGTGPVGAGALTGRGLGLFNDANMMKSGSGLRIGLGLACRRGFGRGYGRNFASMRTYEKTQKEVMQDQKSMLQNQIEAIDKQLENL